MRELTGELVSLTLGALLHDIGKPIQRAALDFYRPSDAAADHSSIGADFLEQINKTAVPVAPGIVEQIRYHHARSLEWAAQAKRIQGTSLAYITYIADNIAAGADRREKEPDAEDFQDPDIPNAHFGNRGFKKSQNLESVFNVFGATKNNLVYAGELPDETENAFLFPESKDSVCDFSKSDYTTIGYPLKHALEAIEYRSAYVSSLLTVLEETLSYVPSSTARSEQADISLYDHSKLTAAFAGAIYYYLKEKGIDNYCETLFKNAKDFYKEKAFLLVSFDISGIQDFIYTIHGSGAAKTLRARSFYLEMFAEVLIDELLLSANLSRANLIYSGGGHGYLLLPNTAAALRAIDESEAKTNEFLLDQFKQQLYVAFASAPFSASIVMPVRDGAGKDHFDSKTYQQLYRDLSRKLSAKKLHRYSAEQIRKLNAIRQEGRECPVCHEQKELTVVPNQDEQWCETCAKLYDISNKVTDKSMFCYTTQDGSGSPAIPIAKDLFLSFADDEKDMRKKLKDGALVGAYAVNVPHSGVNQQTCIWVGNHSFGREFSDLCKKSVGIERLGALRLDIDNLGASFVGIKDGAPAGFNVQGEGRFNTFSRSATFSRSLSRFFKLYINQVLARPQYVGLTSGRPGRSPVEIKEAGGRACQVIYSGGDDVFLIGAWSDVLETAIELQSEFERYGQGKLTVSAGLGLFEDKFPVSVMARTAGDLEDAAKRYERPNGVPKNALALFSEANVFDWDTLKTRVIEEKYCAIKQFFEIDGMAGEEEGQGYGKAFIYRLLGLLREKRDEVEALYREVPKGTPLPHKTIAFARWAYFISRMEPKKVRDSEENERRQEAYRSFTNRLHQWFGNYEDARQLEMALELYVYTIRE